MKENPRIKRQHIEAVLRHVLFFEKDDFEMNPSDQHVYFCAYAATHDEKAAYEVLDLAMKEQES